MDHMLVFQLSQWSLNYLLNGHLGFTNDGEGGVTSGRRFRVSSNVTVGGRQVNGQATVIAEAFEAATLLFCFGELPISPNPRVGVTCFWCIRRCNWVVAQFCWWRG